MNLGKKTVKMPTSKPPVQQITFNDIATNAMSLHLSMTSEIEFVEIDEGSAVPDFEQVGGVDAATRAVTIIGKSIMEFVPALGFDAAIFVVGAALKKIDKNPELHKSVNMNTICNFAALTNMTIISSATNLAAYHKAEEEKRRAADKIPTNEPSQL